MILGLGNDLIDIRRIEQTLKRFGERFENRVFTEAERQKAHSRDKAGPDIVAATYAKRFAIKEACVKALGIRENLGWHDMEITQLPTGAPALTLHGAAKQRLKALTPNGAHARIFVTVADEYPYAQAIVIIAAEPLPSAS